MNLAKRRSIAHSLFLAAALVVALIAAAIGVTKTAAQDSSSGNPPNVFYEGKPAAGKAIFDAPGSCISCHRVGAAGAIYGPNLTDVGSRISPAGLRILLTTPPQKARPENRLFELTLRSGNTVRGKLLNQDPYSVQLLDTEGKLVAFQRSQIRSGKFADPPQMPSYNGKLTNNQIADLVAYLALLRAPEN
jgi:putative heme-binding domain-containing protein